VLAVGEYDENPMLRTLILRALLATPVVLTVGCGSSSCSDGPASNDGPPKCREDVPCSAGTPPGNPKPVDDAGRVAVTAKEAWPNRGDGLPPLTAQQLADACALIAACKLNDDGTPLSDADQAKLTDTCARGTAPMNGKEEREIPQEGQNERFVVEALHVLAAPHDCASIRAQGTKRPVEILCQEDGCWWQSTAPPTACCKPIPTVTCAGDVATLVTEGLTVVRDCAAAVAKCDPKSSTGCTDRAPVGCDPAGSDRCDGDIKLGCDGEGRVSFHDCARYPGGTCVSGDAGVACDLHNDKCPATAGCVDGDKLAVCVAGTTMTVGCGALGMAGCAKGHCVPK
jgi:hypothetical protein